MFHAVSAHAHLGISHCGWIPELRWRRKRFIFADPLDSMVFTIFDDIYHYMGKTEETHIYPLVFNECGDGNSRVHMGGPSLMVLRLLWSFRRINTNQFSLALPHSRATNEKVGGS